MIFLKRKLLYCICILVCIAFLRQLYSHFILVAETIPVTLPKNITRTASSANDIAIVIRLASYSQKLSNTILNISSPVLYVMDSYVANNASLKKSNIQFVNSKLDLLYLSMQKDPLDSTEKHFILLMAGLPKELREDDAKIMLSRARKYPKDILIVPFKTKIPLQCAGIDLNLKQWTLEYRKLRIGDSCMAAKGNFALFAAKSVFKQFWSLWLHPFPEALFIEAAARGVNVRLVQDVAMARGMHWSSGGASDARKKILERVEMYNKLQVKKVVRSGVVEWYGCTRNTTRCFGTIHDDTPEYLLQGRWTPPCCLRVLRETARYVFRSLEHHRVRYWLEGGSLLGAMRSGDIIPWDYDVDVGVYQKDLDKIPYIRELKKQAVKGVELPSVVDKAGYVWEASRPTEGLHYRVQASRTNRLHVDLFPFYSRDGVMTKDTWVPHKQDMEFAELFLKPLTKISFAGTTASAPNNIRDFLEMKFGLGCIENPQYPNPSLVAYPNVNPTEREH